jgi:hypothetical protein
MLFRTLIKVGDYLECRWIRQVDKGEYGSFNGIYARN